MWGFFIGLFLGTLFGMVIMCILIAGDDSR